ncbi:MAG: hypothetical protein KDA20_09880 [Phycisphaerales bacterium]|nr:hypothetical protein [Phycisphaerales bacterium]
MRAEADAVHSTRRTFLGLMPMGIAVGAATVAAWPRSIVRAADVDGPAGGAISGHFPQQHPELARRVVGASHSNIDVVRELVEAQPALAKAAIDWGFGDWETALGAASHTGRREIAELLLHHGARPNIFTHAMLGHLEVVKAIVAVRPEVVRLPGPHSITLYQHAQAGKDGAAEVRRFLEGLPDVPRTQPAQVLDESSHPIYEGAYVFDAGADDRLIVAPGRQGLLQLRRGSDGTPRNLFCLGEHTFYPAGAEAVRVVFAVDDGRAQSVAIHDAEVVVVGQREK